MQERTTTGSMTSHSLTHSLIHSLTHSLTHSLIHSLTHSLTHSFTHSLIHSLTHSSVLPSLQRCVGADIDKDGVPNSCDNCPYLFNPDQRDHECQAVDGSCPYDLSEGLLWPLTPGGEEVERPCPAPLSGVVRRQCNGSGTWLNTSLGMCLSPSGRQLNDTVSSLTHSLPH